MVGCEMTVAVQLCVFANHQPPLVAGLQRRGLLERMGKVKSFNESVDH